MSRCPAPGWRQQADADFAAFGIDAGTPGAYTLDHILCPTHVSTLQTDGKDLEITVNYFSIMGNYAT
jgi:hypothetical protein